MIIPIRLQIKPEIANPLPFSFLLEISFVAILDKTTPRIPRTNPISGTMIERIPSVNEIIDLLFVSIFPTIFLTLHYKVLLFTLLQQTSSVM